MDDNEVNYLEKLLPDWMPPEVFYAVVAIIIFLMIAGLFIFKAGNRSHNRRIRAIQDRRAELRGELHKGRGRRNSPEKSVNFIRRVVNRFHLIKNTGATQAQSLMIEAGYRSRDALVTYAFFLLVMPFLFLVIGFVLMSMDIWGKGLGTKLRFAAPVALMYIGMKLPMWTVAWNRNKRYLKIQRALADTLDLMTICAEAGLSLAMSLERVARELGIAYPEMAEELALTATELGFLPERSKALINFSERVKLPEIRGIVSVLIQTEKYGTPIAQAMRVLSAEFREQRMLRAENKAARLPALMTLPVVVFILPTLFIVIIAPAGIKISDTMKGSSVGGERPPTINSSR